jgi:hypothetical protein
MEVSGQFHAPAALLTRERALGTHRIGGWVSTEVDLDDVEKGKSYSAGNGTHAVEPVDPRYTDFLFETVKAKLIYYRSSSQ